eukprot:1157244-Pelagomonas_calceolata.AAC.3
MGLVGADWMVTPKYRRSQGDGSSDSLGLWEMAFLSQHHQLHGVGTSHRPLPVPRHSSGISRKCVARRVPGAAPPQQQRYSTKTSATLLDNIVRPLTSLGQVRLQAGASSHRCACMHTLTFPHH